jgi:quinol monooxygenase YgiN
VLVLAGSVRIDPAKRNDVVEATIEVMQESRKLPGCISFVFAADLEDPGVLHVFQEWETPEALNRHLTAPRVEAIRLRLGSLGVREVAVQRYSISSVGPIV